MATVSDFETPILTVADVLSQIDVPPDRVVLFGRIGARTVEDLVYLEDHHDRIGELVDGILVEMAMGFAESSLAMILFHFRLIPTSPCKC